jgi:sec-independent protein translocase protein TatA
MLMSVSMEMIGFFGSLGPMELVVIGLVGLLIFGKRLPDLAKSLGRSVVEFKKGLNAPAEEEQAKSLNNNQADILPPPPKRPEQPNQSQQP